MWIKPTNVICQSGTHRVRRNRKDMQVQNVWRGNMETLDRTSNSVIDITRDREIVNKRNRLHEDMLSHSCSASITRTTTKTTTTTRKTAKTALRVNAKSESTPACRDKLTNHGHSVRATHVSIWRVHTLSSHSCVKVVFCTIIYELEVQGKGRRDDM